MSSFFGVSSMPNEIGPAGIRWVRTWMKIAAAQKGNIYRETANYKFLRLPPCFSLTCYTRFLFFVSLYWWDSNFDANYVKVNQPIPREYNDLKTDLSKIYSNPSEQAVSATHHGSFRSSDWSYAFNRPVSITSECGFCTCKTRHLQTFVPIRHDGSSKTNVYVGNCAYLSNCGSRSCTGHAYQTTSYVKIYAKKTNHANRTAD